MNVSSGVGKLIIEMVFILEKFEYNNFPAKIWIYGYKIGKKNENLAIKCEKKFGFVAKNVKNLNLAP